MIEKCQAAYVALPIGISDGLPELLSGRGMINPAFFADAFGACASPLPAFLIAAIVIKRLTDTHRFLPRFGFVLSVVGVMAAGGFFAVFWLIYSAILWART